MSNTPKLWLDVTVTLDDASDSAYANWWACPPENYINFDAYNQALITVQARVLGLHATNPPEVSLDIERTNINGPGDDRFGSALGSLIDLPRDVVTVAQIVLGREDATNLDAGGVGRLTLTNAASAGGDAAMVQIRAWVALARYERLAGRPVVSFPRQAQPRIATVRR
ncbi:MAG: hypothetical protein H6747_05760 [Deltaproteobacteria bacterium]|nr:hypothetical protein [Deltaproteobacteria bacterium]